MNVEEPGEVGTVERVGKMFPVKLVFGFAQHEASYVMGGGGDCQWTVLDCHWTVDTILVNGLSKYTLNK